MITHLISIRVDNDEHETYHYFTNNFNKLQEEPVIGIIFGNMKSGIFLNRDVKKPQTFKYDTSLIEEYKDVEYIEYMLNYYPYDYQSKKYTKNNVYNTLYQILEIKRWDMISKDLEKK